MPEGYGCSSLRGTFVVRVLAGGLLLSGCAPGLNPSGPVISPTGIVYELGIPPVETRFSQTAVMYLRQENVERALELALEGMGPDPSNPIHYYLAGTAYARLGRNEEAAAMFADAERIYPAYELNTEPERERAWAEAFNEGIEAFDADDVTSAIDAWGRAVKIYDLRPDAHQNLAVVLAGEGRHNEAIEIYRQTLAGLGKYPSTRVLSDGELAERVALRVDVEENLGQLFLFMARYEEAEPILREQLKRDSDNLSLQRDLARALSGVGRDAEATEIYAALLSTGRLDAAELFNVGVTLFRSADFAEAAKAFKQVTELQPNSRDGWFNYVNSLFAAEEWESLTSAGERLVELDPLSENAGLIAARASLEVGDDEAVLSGLERTEGVPIHVEDLQFRPAGAETKVEGRVIGNGAETGTVVRLRFTFYGNDGILGSRILTVRAPALGESEELEVLFSGPATAYRYEVLP